MSPAKTAVLAGNWSLSRVCEINTRRHPQIVLAMANMTPSFGRSPVLQMVPQVSPYALGLDECDLAMADLRQLQGTEGEQEAQQVAKQAGAGIENMFEGSFSRSLSWKSPS